MKLSARNQLKGKIIGIDEGAVNGIVKIELAGGDVISATISMAAIKELGLEIVQFGRSEKIDTEISVGDMVLVSTDNPLRFCSEV